jgi:YVTN family beta-propeller protein
MGGANRRFAMPGLQGLMARSAGRHSRLAGSAALSMLIIIAAVGPASAATVTSTWNAKIGTGGANGSARIQANSAGTGSLTLKLAKLKPSSVLPVVIVKGTCSSVRSTVITVASVRTTSRGAATRTSSLTAAQMKSIVSATKGSGKIAIRIGSGSSRKGGGVVMAPPPVIDPTVSATIPVGVYPLDVTIDPTGIWVTNSLFGSLSRIDPATNTVLSVSQLDLEGIAGVEGIASGFGSIWVTVVRFDELGSSVPGSVIRVNPATGSPIGAPIAVGKGPLGITASAEAMWVSNLMDGTVSRIDPVTNAVVATVPVGDSPFDIVAGFGSIWVANVHDGKVYRIDPATNLATTTVQTQQSATGITVGAGAVWVSYCGCNGAQGVVSRIDPVTNMVTAAVPVGASPGLLAFGGGFVWVAVDGDTSVVQIDPATNAVKKRVAVGATTWGIAASDHAVWAVHPNQASDVLDVSALGTVTRISF